MNALNKIILADDQAMFRGGMAKVIALQDHFRVVGQYVDCERLMLGAPTFRSSIIIVASSLQPDMHGLIQSSSNAGSKLIVIAENTESAHSYTTLGVFGVIFRDISSAELIDCVRRVATGKVYLQQKPAHAMAISDAICIRVRSRLKPKDMQIIALVVQGYKNKEIASELGTTVQVIKNRLQNIYDTTGVYDRLGLALFTIHHHLLAEAAIQTVREIERCYSDAPACIERLQLGMKPPGIPEPASVLA